MFWIFMIILASFAFVLTIIIADAAIDKNKKKTKPKKADVKKSEVKTKHGTYDVKLWEVASPYEERCFRIEFLQKGTMVDKNIAFFHPQERYVDIIKYFVEVFDNTKLEEQKIKSQQEIDRFELEAWDGDVYEENTTELPKEKKKKK